MVVANIVYLLDACVVNARLLYRKVRAEKTSEGLLKFRREIALTLLKKYGKPSHQGKCAPTPIIDVRFDHVGHWSLPNKTERRCAKLQRKG